MREKPALLMLTSSFPRSPEDETCGYVREFARALSDDFEVTVLAPPDNESSAWPAGPFRFARSRSPLPRAWRVFQAGRDLNDSLRLIAFPALAIELFCFAIAALRLAWSADVICSHWLAPAGVIGAGLARLFGKPHVVIEHSGALHLFYRHRGGAWLARFVARGSREIVLVSESLRDRYAALCPEAAAKLRVLPMGVTRPAEAANIDNEAMPSRRTVLFIGRLVEIKGVDLLLRAMAELPQARLIVAGEGEARTALERLSRELGVDAHFVGRVGRREREALLSACDVLAIPSRVLPNGRTEGAPVVCLEAMAAGCAIVAARTGGLAEMIEEGRTGILFEPENHRDLAEKLRLLLFDENLRRRLGANARYAAEPYAWDRLGPRFANLIEKHVKENGAIDRCKRANA